MNVTAAIAKVLRADASITALAGSRVFGGELPNREVQSMPRPVVVLRATGGGSLGPGARSYAPWRVNRLDIFCYGRTPHEGSELHDAVYKAMTQLRQTVAADTVLKNASVSGGPVQTRDPDTDWPYTLGIYDVSATES